MSSFFEPDIELMRFEQLAKSVRVRSLEDRAMAGHRAANKAARLKEEFDPTTEPDYNKRTQPPPKPISGLETLPQAIPHQDKPAPVPAWRKRLEKSIRRK